MVEDEARPIGAGRAALAQLAAFIGGALAGALGMMAAMLLGQLLGLGSVGALAALIAAPMGGYLGGAFSAALVAGRSDSGAKALGVLAGLMVLVAAVALPSLIRPPAGRIDRSRLLGNLKHVQVGVEVYAADDKERRYPASLAPAAFDWRKYVPSAQPNPFDPARQGARLIEESIPLAPKGGAPFYALVMQDRRPFKVPGAIRYYVSSDRSAFALTTSRRDGALLRYGDAGDGPVVVMGPGGDVSQAYGAGGGR